jgi:hypothetical protein
VIVVPATAALGIVAEASRGDSGVGPVVMVVGLTIASALVLAWIIGKLPGSNENTGAGVFRRRRRDPFATPPEDDPSWRGPFDS